MLRVGSLFSGCLGLDLGLAQAGFETVWCCENDAACLSVIRHHSDLPVYEDVRDVGADAPEVDVLAGGFPCQPVSHAGSRLGRDDPRWLWPQFHRCIRLLRPRIVIVENVTGLATSGLTDVVTDLAQELYVGWCFRLRAADVGAPHRRERIFLVAADAGALGRGGERGRDEPGRGREPARATQPAADSERVAGPQAGERDSGPREGGLEDASGGAGQALDRATGRAGALADAERERLEGVGPAEQAGGVEPSGYGEAAADATCERWAGEDEPRSNVEHDRLQPAHLGAPGIQWGAYEPAIRRWEQVVGPAPRPTDDRGRLNPQFVEWMMGFPDGWTDVGVSRSQRLKMLGNAVQVQVGTEVGRRALLYAEKFATKAPNGGAMSASPATVLGTPERPTLAGGESSPVVQ